MGRVIVATLILAVLVTPLAVAADGDPVIAGQRNTASTETGLISTSPTFATRQSNRRADDGGAAAYGCRSSGGNEPCLFVSALRTARAFDFRTRGDEGGRILVSGADDPRDNVPFTTNATGVATGLNADEVDGEDGPQLKGDFALVNGNGTVANSRGVSSVSRIDEGGYLVNFERDIAACVHVVSIGSATVPGFVGSERTDPDTLLVITRDTDGNQADRQFNLHVAC